MKINLLNIAAFLAFLIVLAMVIGAGWYLFGDFGGWKGTSMNYEEMDQEVTGTETFNGNIKTLSVRAVAGSIQIETWDGDGIEVNYRKRGLTQAGMDKINVIMQQEGSSLNVWTEFPPVSAGNTGWVEYLIKIPAILEQIDAKSVSGSITIGEDSGANLFDEINQELKTTSGSIFTAGAFTLSISSISGSLRFTAGGDEVEAKTVSGRITGVVSANTNNQTIDCDSISGSINLDIPDNWGGSVKMSSVSGSLKSKLPVILEKQSRNSLEGRLGEGDGNLRMKTTSGSISIE
ncbi:MAG: DUF4097 family beta strand repeat protein [Spirochaetales bacterium]|nr:DUF4097 family beta strand repeat protein [Spirochaetales bacterium]